jgi:Tfp pilus assembly PilM family ATPase
MRYLIVSQMVLTMFAMTKKKLEQKMVIGIHFDHAHIYAVEGIAKKTTITVFAATCCTINHDIPLIDQLRDLLASFRGKKVALSINDKQLHRAQTPLDSDLSDEDVEASIAVEAESRLHLSAEEIYFDYYPNAEDSDEKTVNHTFFACSKEALAEPMEALEALNLTVTNITTEQCVLENLALNARDKYISHDTVALINLNINTAKIVIMLGDKTLFSDHVNYDDSKISAIGALIDLAYSHIEGLSIAHLYIGGFIDEKDSVADELSEYLHLPITLLAPFTNCKKDKKFKQPNNEIYYSFAYGLMLEGNHS